MARECFGLTCLILSLSVSYIAQLATMSDMIFILSGLSLLLLEMLVIPGFGIVGIGGIGVMLYGLYLLLLPEVPLREEVLGQAMDGLLIGLVGAIIEAKYDEKKEIMKWPFSVTPYDCVIIPMISKNDNKNIR